MEISQIIPHIEALIFASDKALTAAEITEHVNNALGFIEDRADAEQVAAAIEGIREKYDSEFYAFELKQSGGGWQFLTKPEYHKTVALLNGDKFIKRLSLRHWKHWPSLRISNPSPKVRWKLSAG